VAVDDEGPGRRAKREGAAFGTAQRRAECASRGENRSRRSPGDWQRTRRARDALGGRTRGGGWKVPYSRINEAVVQCPERKKEVLNALTCLNLGGG